MNDKRTSKNKEIKQLQEKVEDLEVVKYLQQDMLAQLMKDVGPERLEKSLPKPLFDEIRKLAKKLK